MAEKCQGRLFRITEDTEYYTDPPLHEKCHAYALLGPHNCPGTQLEFFISEIASGGRALPDTHPGVDHVYFCLSGKALAMVEDEEFRMQPGDILYIPQGAVHSLTNIGGECYRAAVLFAPARTS